ncbi:putative oxidoreductase [Gordonia araii NBRC 100433]|uniref:Putative oxidoreductase n=1 Tax=Gordonia araii NBRC 100433 TaxID=1073574 RepID=G7H3B5_9ACTN|nr:oxidoreductase [Gordonia araii]NNG96459.1 SDR family NAD(P)-dependent oxidoreductase [Gordonia araii NBRC 100433]GAB10340.1 putative oxidoreductase [Gordonia araii NBRC 100433]
MTLDLGDQSGRTAIITGANSGLGKETAIALAKAGADVVLACRNLDKANAAAAEVGPGARVEQLDLASLDSVRDFADRIDRADLLINNAGVMAVPYRKTADGFEMQIGTNHLGHFALTLLLLDKDKVSDRVVTLSSFMHRLGKLDFDDLNWERRRYNRWRAYGDSKLANLLFGKELARRLAASGSSVVSTIAHPGYADTELQSHTESIQDRVMVLGNKLMAQSAADGALPTLYAATSAQARNGGFYGPTKRGGMQGPPGPSAYRKAADNEQLATRLWQISEELTGVSSSV